MEVEVTFFVGPQERAAIAALLHKPDASVEDCIDYMRGAGMEWLRELVDDYLEGHGEDEEKPGG